MSREEPAASMSGLKSTTGDSKSEKPDSGQTPERRKADRGMYISCPELLDTKSIITTCTNENSPIAKFLSIVVAE